MSASGAGPVWSYSTYSMPKPASIPKSLLVPKYAPSAIAMRVPARANVSSTFVTAPMPDA